MNAPIVMQDIYTKETWRTAAMTDGTARASSHSVGMRTQVGQEVYNYRIRYFCEAVS